MLSTTRSLPHIMYHTESLSLPVNRYIIRPIRLSDCSAFDHCNDWNFAATIELVTKFVGEMSTLVWGSSLPEKVPQEHLKG